MGLFKPDAPTPPNPLTTAAAQTGTNVSTAVANAMLNNTNQVTPTGSLTYDQTGTFGWTDPTTGATYNIPRFTATQALTPVGQQLQSLDQQTQLNLGNMALGQSGQLRQLLSTPFNAQTGSFNADAYLQANPDVRAAYQSGALRAPDTPATPATPATTRFDANAYLAAYPDVANAYSILARPGETREQFAQRHYTDRGQAEGRTSGIITVPGTAATAATRGAITETLPEFALRHYQNSGQYEGRAGVPTPAPAAGQASTIANAPGAQTSFADVGQQQRTFGDAGDITRDYGPVDNFSADRSRIEEALYQRMDPQLQRDRSNLEARLADQGIEAGSRAYQAAWDQFNRQLTDTRLGITQTAGQEQQRLNDMAAQRAGFQNAAQMQAFQEAQGRGQFANAAEQQDFAQAQARANFYNTAQAQNLAQAQSAFNAANSQRNQFLAEQYQQRNQPINEITSLLSGAQVQQPSFVNTPNNQIATTDVAGIINNRFNQDMSIYQQQNQNFNQLMGGIFGMAGGLARPAIALSDRTEKENIRRMGTVFASSGVADVDHDEAGRPIVHGVADVDRDEIKRLPVYEYSYKDDPMSMRHIGPMAQDLEKIDPRSVTTRGGKKYIDVTRMASILRVH